MPRRRASASINAVARQVDRHPAGLDLRPFRGRIERALRECRASQRTTQRPVRGPCGGRPTGRTTSRLCLDDQPAGQGSHRRSHRRPAPRPNPRGGCRLGANPGCCRPPEAPAASSSGQRAMTSRVRQGHRPARPRGQAATSGPCGNGRSSSPDQGQPARGEARRSASRQSNPWLVAEVGSRLLDHPRQSSRLT